MIFSEVSTSNHELKCLGGSGGDLSSLYNTLCLFSSENSEVYRVFWPGLLFLRNHIPLHASCLMLMSSRGTGPVVQCGPVVQYDLPAG